MTNIGFRQVLTWWLDTPTWAIAILPEFPPVSVVRFAGGDTFEHLPSPLVDQITER